MDVILSVRQNISDTFETHCLLLMFAGIVLYCYDGFFPLHFSTKVNFLMLSDSKSTLGNHLIPATLMLVSSFNNVFGGSFSLYVTSFSEEPPLFNTNWIWSALCIFWVSRTGETIINIYIPLYNLTVLRKFHYRYTCCFK